MICRFRLGGVLMACVLVTAGGAYAASVTNVSVQEARQMLGSRSKDPTFTVLDVRTPAEFSAGHLPGAVNVDALASDFEHRLRSLDKNTSYLVYCRSGNRSQAAVRAMERLGFRSIFHMTAGMLGWDTQ